jgi:hypothetical protein
VRWTVLECFSEVQRLGEMAIDLFALGRSNIRGDCPKERVKLRLSDSFRDGVDFWCFFL